MQSKKLLVLLLIIPILWACAGQKSFTQMTPKEKSAFFMQTYNQQYEQYKIKAALPNLTDVQKKELRVRKEVLLGVYPLIATYDMTQVSGQPIDPALEARILTEIGRLVSLATK